MTDEAKDLEERERKAQEKMNELQKKIATNPSYRADPSEFYEKIGSSLTAQSLPSGWGEGISV